MKEKYLKLLAQSYPNLQAATSEIINLSAILKLPKGTELFLSDLHGEYDAFCHLLNNASGIIRSKVEMVFGKILPEEEIDKFCTLIYYPSQMIEEAKEKEKCLKSWYIVTLNRLVEICRAVASKYTRSKVRKALPKHCGYIMDELLNIDSSELDKQQYNNGIFDAILEVNRGDAYILALTEAIKQLAVDHIHIVGDIFDRGEFPHLILDMLEKRPSVDIEWGNHDLLWMGAAMGQKACIATVVEICLKYGNSDILESAYGISLRQLAFYADRNVQYDKRFEPNLTGKSTTKKDSELIAKMRKAIFMILLKAEGKTIGRHPEYEMGNRFVLPLIDGKSGTVKIDGENVPLVQNDFKDMKGFDFTVEEGEIISNLKKAFLSSEKLKRHLNFLMTRGSMYKVHNDNLIFHGCIPLKENGDYCTFTTKSGKQVEGKDYLDYLDGQVRKAYSSYLSGRSNKEYVDFLWYLWCGKLSPVFGREKMTTFERLYVKDEKYHIEGKNPYYKHIKQKEFCQKVLSDFGITQERSHIINGHIPVKEIEGESPIKAGGKLLFIDGGFCKAYHKKTGIAGYTLIFNSHGLRLAAHEPFSSTQEAIENRAEIHSNVTVFETSTDRITVEQTFNGKRIQEKIQDLKELVKHYTKFE